MYCSLLPNLKRLIMQNDNIRNSRQYDIQHNELTVMLDYRSISSFLPVSLADKGTSTPHVIHQIIVTNHYVVWGDAAAVLVVLHCLLVELRRISQLKQLSQSN